MVDQVITVRAGRMKLWTKKRLERDLFGCIIDLEISRDAFVASEPILRWLTKSVVRSIWMQRGGRKGWDVCSRKREMRGIRNKRKMKWNEGAGVREGMVSKHSKMAYKSAVKTSSRFQGRKSCYQPSSQNSPIIGVGIICITEDRIWRESDDFVRMRDVKLDLII